MARKRRLEQLEDLTLANAKLALQLQTELDEAKLRIAILEAENDLIEQAAEANDVPIDGPAAPVEDSYAGDLTRAQANTAAWDITDSGARVYSAGGRNAIDTLESLLQAALRDGLSDPAIIDVHVGYANAQDEEGLPFDGLLTVAV